MKRIQFILPLVFFLPISTLAQDIEKDRNELRPDEFIIEYIAHACFRIHTSDKTIMLDPYADKVWIGYSFPKDIAADTIFITHPHYDHDGGIHLGHRPEWIEDTPFIMIPKKYTVGDMTVTGYAGKHSEPYGKEFNAMNTIWIVNVKGVNIGHVGDNGPLTDSIASLLPPLDVLMLPLDTQHHILSIEELEHWQTRTGAKMIFPMHYRIDDIDPETPKPKGLGQLDVPLMKKGHMKQFDSHYLKMKKSDVPTSMTYYVLDHYRNN
ncbi:MAG: MBL fold metallo-hydrolase [Cyclobacteriaceae bacterium]